MSHTPVIAISITLQVILVFFEFSIALFSANLVYHSLIFYLLTTKIKKPAKYKQENTSISSHQ